MKTRKKWSKEELSKLLGLYPKASWEEIHKAFPDVTEAAIVHKANRLSLRREIPRWLTGNNLTISDYDLGFLIGFTEGEGSFGIYKLKRGHYQPHIYICNTDWPLIEKIQSILLGLGDVYTETQHRWKKMWRYHIKKTDQVRQFLSATESHLVSRKKKIAQLILELIDLKIQGAWKKTINSSRQEEIYQEVRTLNKRGDTFVNGVRKITYEVIKYDKEILSQW